GFDIGFDMVTECADFVNNMAAVNAAIPGLEQDVDDAQAAVDAANPNDMGYAQLVADLEQAELALDEANFTYNRDRGRLVTLEQTLQYICLIHLVYENGAEL